MEPWPVENNGELLCVKFAIRILFYVNLLNEEDMIVKMQIPNPRLVTVMDEMTLFFFKYTTIKF